MNKNNTVCKILTEIIIKKKNRSNASDQRWVSWFNPTWQLSTTQLCSVTPHCSRMMERIRKKKKVRKHVSWDKSGLIGQKIKINWCVREFLTTQWLTHSQFPSHGPWPAFPTVYTLSILPYSMEYLHRQFGSPVLAVPLPSFLCPSSLLLHEKLKSPWFWVRAT